MLVLGGLLGISPQRMRCSGYFVFKCTEEEVYLVGN